LFDALIRGESPHPATRKLATKTRILAVAHSEDFMILSCVVLTQYSSVTDRRTDGRTDASAVAKTSLALHAVARKNQSDSGERHR